MPSARRSSASRRSRSTDRNGLYGAMPFSEACIGKGVQPIIGAMLGSRAAARNRRRGKRSTGWCCWPRTIRATPTSASWCRPRISTGPSSKTRTSTLRRLEELSEGLIALTAGGEGRAWPGCSPTGSSSRPRPISTGCRRCFPDRLYIELSAPRRRGRGSGRRRADRPRLCARPAAGRDQSRGLRGPGLPCRARRHAVHRQLGLCRKRRPRHVLGRRLAQGRRGDGASCSPTCPRRWPTPL